MGATSILVSTFVSPLHLIVQTYFIISNAFQTKIWPSNLEKFRRVLVFDAEKVCVSERFSLIRRRKKSVQLCPQETTHPIFQFHQIVQFHVKEIVHPLRFLSWRDSEFLIPRPTA